MGDRCSEGLAGPVPGGWRNDGRRCLSATLSPDHDDDGRRHGVPLALGQGTGSELHQPLGYAMVGGLALSQLLTLYATPVISLYLDRLQTWLQGRARNEVCNRQNQNTRAAAAQ
jgi:hypothetical protein